MTRLCAAHGIPDPCMQGGGVTSCAGSEMLRNESYRGVLVWNRTRKERNPETGRKTSRPRPESEWLRVDVPEWRMVSEELWQAVQKRTEEMRKHFGVKTAPEGADVYADDAFGSNAPATLKDARRPKNRAGNPRAFQDDDILAGTRQEERRHHCCRTPQPRSNGHVCI